MYDLGKLQFYTTLGISAYGSSPLPSTTEKFRFSQGSSTFAEFTHKHYEQLISFTTF